MSKSKLVSKFHANLTLKTGNQIIFEITQNKQIIIKKDMPTDLAYLKALESTLIEWHSDNDTQDYGDV